MAKITVKVDPELCIGAASCVTIAPETFQLNVENKADVQDHGPRQMVQNTNACLMSRQTNVNRYCWPAVLSDTCRFIFDEQGKQLFPDL